MDTIIVLAIFSGTTVATGFFLALYFMLHKSENQLIYKLSGMLFLAISLRIGKSILYYTSGIPNIGVAIGFLGLASIGPLCWMIVRYSQSTATTISSKDCRHFLFPFLGFTPVWLLPGWWPTYFYWVATLLLALYLAFSWKAFLLSSIENTIPQKWLKLILTSLFLVWLALVYQHLTNEIIQYAIAAGFAGLIFYRLLFFILKNPILYPRPNQIKVKTEAIEKIKYVVYQDKIFLKHAITVNQLAELINEPAYIISKTIKIEFGMTFPELINHLRIETAKNRLLNISNEEIKIENLAYEVGFNTPSAFYAAFKKDTNLSPKEFQKRAAST